MQYNDSVHEEETIMIDSLKTLKNSYIEFYIKIYNTHTPINNNSIFCNTEYSFNAVHELFLLDNLIWLD